MKNYLDILIDLYKNKNVPNILIHGGNITGKKKISM
tara:strand:- start:9 stop:116 length:108 start_codon:yes stop_codon:yes gene_type:complete